MPNYTEPSIVVLKTTITTTIEGLLTITTRVTGPGPSRTRTRTLVTAIAVG